MHGRHVITLDSSIFRANIHKDDNWVTGGVLLLEVTKYSLP